VPNPKNICAKFSEVDLVINDLEPFYRSVNKSYLIYKTVFRAFLLFVAFLKRNAPVPLHISIYSTFLIHNITFGLCN